MEHARKRHVAGFRVAFIWTGHRTPSYLSGMPWAMEHALRRAGLDVTPLLVPLHDAPGGDLLGRMAGPRARTPLRRRALEPLRFARRRVRAIDESLRPDTTAARHLEKAHWRSEQLTRLIREASPDRVFACCVSGVLSRADFDAPLVFFSDNTARRLFAEYDEYRARGVGYRRAAEDLERDALARCAHLAYASEWARASAVTHYGAPIELTSVIPMGANITPADLGEATPSEAARCASPPSRDELRMCMIAADPHRKGVDLAVRAAARLRSAGWNATLRVVGPMCRAVRRSPSAIGVGRLDLAQARDRRRLARIMGESHVHLLPSRAEAFGIAACEAAHFGRPAVVSDAGGLPSIVSDGETGRVVPCGSPADFYAEAILDVVSDRERYAAMSRAARRRAAERLHWDVWGRAMAERIRVARGVVRRRSA